IHVPNLAVAVLQPFKIAGDYPARVAENIRNNICSLISEHKVSRRVQRSVGTFCYQFCLYNSGIGHRYLIAKRSRNYNIAVDSEKISVAVWLCIRESSDKPVVV